MEEEQVRAIKIIVFGVISWGLAFILTRRIFSSYSFSFSNRLLSTAHATIAVTLATLSVQDLSCPVCPLASKPSPKQMDVMAFSLSYMIYDLICCHFDKVFSIDNAVHHFVSILGFIAGLAYQKSGSEIVATLWVAEISSPFFHLREILKEIGYKDTSLNLAADLLKAPPCFVLIDDRCVLPLYSHWRGLCVDLFLFTSVYQLIIPSSSRQWDQDYNS
ncbi:transmembrane protein 136 isoform X2 [Arabidopsis lyrata subsp. lyrata]|uniref:transmembrane protein 136 isoform X2 n=1 Tax=Arabidopsis lyrata subsp. lyrata TaxID=81972 RepID=UPI000A29B4C1|nr:transmembrane protein 136 isoform X2 [Arabidopsis lyrata subsp. lyrata]|eukprot:XP_020870627.1 transmembrane protein 136 isoform X2 [Arabidopsis lyrata subsp. lyrata]